MDYHIQQLPQEYAKQIRIKLQEYKESAETDDEARIAIVSSIFDCASKNYDKIQDLEQICRIQMGYEYNLQNNEGPFRAAVWNKIFSILNKIVNSTQRRDLQIGEKDWCLMKFIGPFCMEEEYLYRNPNNQKICYLIKTCFFKPISCSCIANNDSKMLCHRRECQIIPFTPQQINDLQNISSEYRIQCGIVLFESIKRLLIDLHMIQECYYWHGRLKKCWPYLGKHTQNMIRDYLQPKRNEFKTSDEDFKNEEKIESEKDTHEIIKNLMAENDQLRSQLKQEAIQIMDFKFKIEELERIIENRNLSHKTIIKCSNIRRIHQKYEKILKTDGYSLYLSNIDKLLQLHPKSIEILTMKVEILKIEGNIEEYLRRINESYWKIERNPDISMDELGAEIEQIPSEEFMEKYQKLIVENSFT
ncbi:unnamed protein product [Caenorhabditis angaria]|uniref:Uncharacterized protein n=1 Tax=Caenorhabditis angaria TaxID=860376 RepID=A0A9P1NA07_9PELO|nr:unnamed protein product [Caenorhabditis angaria]